MSYCTARRIAAQGQVSICERALRDAKAAGSSPELIQQLEARLAEHQRIVVTLGDCGD